MVKPIISKFSGDKSLFINRFFSKIFIINLKDKTKRFKKVSNQFIKKGVKYQRFNAVDGRADPKDYPKKKKELEKKYGVKIKRGINPPTASLVIGTLEILKKQVKNKWKRILICEDDVILDRKIIKRFHEGVDELGDEEWDLLYLGCGNTCGVRGISDTKTRLNKYMTSLSIVNKDEYNWYVQNRLDLRGPVYKDIEYSKNLSMPIIPGGTWGYGISLEGAKRILKLFGNNVKNHIDQLLGKEISKENLIAYSFDPPIIWHEDGAFRADSDIPWEW